MGNCYNDILLFGGCKTHVGILLVMLDEPDVGNSLLCVRKESLSFVLVVVLIAGKLLFLET